MGRSPSAYHRPERGPTSSMAVRYTGQRPPQGCLQRHDGIVVADGDHVEGNLPVRPPSAGVAAVQQIALTTWDWATLLKRVWGFDALACTGCGGRMQFIAVIKDRAVIERILKHIGEDAEEPRFARARDPCDLWA